MRQGGRQNFNDCYLFILVLVFENLWIYHQPSNYEYILLDY